VKILVTGAGGFVGGHLLPVLSAAFPAAELIGRGNAKGARPLELTDTASVDDAIRRTMPDACVHLAAVAAVGVARTDPDLAWRVNLGGTLAVARAILRHAPACRLVFASTADLYGASFRAGVALDETALPAPLNTYSATKAAADLALGAMAAEGLRVVRMRPFNHTGPGQSTAFVVPAFARQVMRIQAGLQPAVMRVGDLSPMRDFLDVRDVCAAYAACLRPEIELRCGQILNIASGRPVRIADVLQGLLDVAGVQARIETDTDLLRPTDIPVAIGNAEAAHRLLGWQPKIAWQTTLGDVIEDWRARVRSEEVAR
jgi:GDP-4-dehydro-6-deoxy-D-mannose reductase